jgi:glyoxylase-like metal-dependent hydrolase (beta-lactamase superfamily II)
MERSLTQTHPGVWRLIANNPSPMTGLGTNTYLVGHDRVVIIDPGPNNLSHFDNTLAALQTLQASVQTVIITHPHSDHNGCAQQLADQLEVPLLGFGNRLWHGAQVQVEGMTLQVHHTPGHIYAHICLFLLEQQLLFTGDLVAGEGTILIIPPDGDMAAYLDSLRAMLALEVVAILPGHGPVIETPQALLQEYLDHRLARERQVLHWLDQGYQTAREIAAQIYADRPEALDIASLQVEAHLEKLRKEGRL